MAWLIGIGAWVIALLFIWSWFAAGARRDRVIRRAVDMDIRRRRMRQVELTALRRATGAYGAARE